MTGERKRVARKRVMIASCDVCGRSELDAVTVRGWVVRPEGGSQRRLDLCEEHSAPLVEVYGEPRSTRVEDRPATMEEIEQAKVAKTTKAAKKAPAKKSPTRRRSTGG